MSIQQTLLTAFLIIVFQNCRMENSDRSEDVAKEPDETINRGSSDEPTPVKMIDYITGSWSLYRVFDGGEDITTKSGVAKNNKIEFKREGRYIRYAGVNKTDSGGYRVNEQQESLYLDSHNKNKVEEWNVSFADDGLMTMEIRNTLGHGEDIKYIYQRIGERDTLDLVGEESMK